MMPAGIDVIGGNIAQRFMITPVVVIFDEAAYRLLQLTGHVMRQLGDFTFQRVAVPLNCKSSGKIGQS